MPLNHNRAGVWFQMEHKDTIIAVGYIEDIIGERGDVKVRFIRRHGKSCDERQTICGGTIVRRIEEPPNVLVQLLKTEEQVKTKASKVVTVSDCLGCRPTAASGRINARLSIEEARTIEQIVRDSGLSESRIKAHLKFWIDKAEEKDYDREYKIVECEKGKYILEKVRKYPIQSPATP